MIVESPATITTAPLCPRTAASLLLFLSFRSGSVLAVDVVAPEPLPPFPASTMDGYAVVAADGEGVLEVRGRDAGVEGGRASCLRFSRLYIQLRVFCG